MGRRDRERERRQKSRLDAVPQETRHQARNALRPVRVASRSSERAHAARDEQPARKHQRERPRRDDGEFVTAGQRVGKIRPNEGQRDDGDAGAQGQSKHEPWLYQNI
jgi:hypothetical protein